MSENDGMDRIERARRWMKQQEPARQWSRHDAGRFLDEFDRRSEPRRTVAARTVLAEMSAAWMVVADPGYDDDYDFDDDLYPHRDFDDDYGRLWRADVPVHDEELYEEAAKYLNARPGLL